MFITVHGQKGPSLSQQEFQYNLRYNKSLNKHFKLDFHKSKIIQPNDLRKQTKSLNWSQVISSFKQKSINKHCITINGVKSKSLNVT